MLGVSSNDTILNITTKDVDTILREQGRYSALALNDYSIGVENVYAFLFALMLLVDGGMKFFFIFLKSFECCKKCMCPTLEFYVYGALYCSIAAFEIYLLIMIKQLQTLSWTSPATLFFVSIIIDSI